MALKVSKVNVWAASMLDKPGQLAAKLAVLKDAGVNLEFVVARRKSGKPKGGVVFVTSLKGAKQIKAAKGAGFKLSKSLQSVRVEGYNKAGLGAALTSALAEAGINLRGLSAAAIGRKCVSYFAFDKPADATKAVRILKKL